VLEAVFAPVLRTIICCCGSGEGEDPIKEKSFEGIHFGKCMTKEELIIGKEPVLLTICQAGLRAYSRLSVTLCVRVG